MTQDVNKLPMPEQLFNNWMAELRSGKYTKIRGTLKRTSFDGTLCHCNLGVLLESLNVPSCLHEEGSLYWEWDMTVLHPDAGCQSWIELIEMDTELSTYAVRINDGYDLTFTEMADKLEAKYDSMVKS